MVGADFSLTDGLKVIGDAPQICSLSKGHCEMSLFDLDFEVENG